MRSFRFWLFESIVIDRMQIVLWPLAAFAPGLLVTYVIFARRRGVNRQSSVEEMSSSCATMLNTQRIHRS